jgi:protein-disulfide isomerase
MKALRLRNAKVFKALWLVLLALTQAMPADAETHDGMPVGLTDEGYPYIGTADAPVTLEEWSDYLCPYCSRHFRQTWPQLLDDYVGKGQLKIVFRDLPLASLHPTAAQGHIAANCVGEQGAAGYWAMHEALFTRQGEWNRLPDPDAFLAGVAEGLGIDMARYKTCAGNGDSAASVQASVEEGRSLGYNGTPSFRFRVDARDETWEISGAHPMARFARYIDALIAGEEPPEDPKPEPPELPFWAKPEGLAPDPDRPGFNLAGDAYKGNPGAKLVVVEFNDFQCPACQTHARETQPLIDDQLVATGKILWVDKHFPLRVHQHALVAAVAAECAGEQQQYWAMHAALHADSERWAHEDAGQALLVLAESLDLDMDRFARCFDSREGLERVVSDLYDAQGVITRAPTFVIIEGARGSMTGPLDGESFVKLLEGRLAAMEADGSAGSDGAR